ncbi:hypothetical protein [Halorussus caseinilyticus]|nr:hypothetical protein [Halorussus sp. DT72]
MWATEGGRNPLGRQSRIVAVAESVVARAVEASLALAGFAAFYGLERLARESRSPETVGGARTETTAGYAAVLLLV